jgi:hypothetical protein
VPGSLLLDAGKNEKTGWYGYDYRAMQGNVLQEYKQGYSNNRLH